MRQPLTERYRERLAGVLSCYDRVIITGTLPGACYATGMTGFLSARQIRIFDYPRALWPSSRRCFQQPRGSLVTPRWRGQSRANSSLKPNSLLAGKIQGIFGIL